METQKIKEMIEEIKNLRIVELDDDEKIDGLFKLKETIDQIFKINQKRKIFKI